MIVVMEQLKIAPLVSILLVLAKLNLLANKSIYWPKRHLASESEQNQPTSRGIHNYNTSLLFRKLSHADDI
jgi:hypothetical protein